ncbi:homocysteine S-methyltransferase 2 [Trichonephila clavipes]|nr:homocysteine S-methyltransferase 2 [Trichonephila clavipes]
MGTPESQLRQCYPFLFMMWGSCPADKVYVLDGGLATELERDGFSLLHDPLWSARILHEKPESIVRVHNRYLESGAEIIITASYQASISGFQKHLGLTFEQSKNLLKLSVELAHKAKMQYYDNSKETREILVAGSIGSYGAALADGSEYTGDYCDKLTQESLDKSAGAGIRTRDLRKFSPTLCQLGYRDL